MTLSPRRILAATSASGVAALALLFSTGGVAAAHVGVSGTSTAAGSSTVLTFSSGHGCSTSPTTEFAIQIPSEINSATPTQLAGWKVEKVMETLDTPITDSHGNQVTERVDQIVYTADEPLVDGVRVAFEISLRLPESAAPGSAVYFPTIQRCAEGQNDWIEVPATGQDADSLDSPAPALTVTEAKAGNGHGAAENQEPTAAASDTSTSTSAVSIVALILGAAGVLLGGGALLRGRAKA